MWSGSTISIDPTPIRVCVSPSLLAELGPCAWLVLDGWCNEIATLGPPEKASIKTFRFSDLLSATTGTSPSKKKRRNRGLYALSVLFLLAYFTVSASRTSHAHVREWRRKSRRLEYSTW